MLETDLGFLNVNECNKVADKIEGEAYCVPFYIELGKKNIVVNHTHMWIL
jgi:hypothetical protein|tara:strand:+ start:70 stop:219 length:150 start_codon:yes stop_codon:yes gene_type:complete